MSGIQAARVAASLRGDPHLQVETVEGRYGEFTVLADDEEIIRGGPLGFVGVLPSLRTVRDLIDRRQIAAQAGQPGKKKGLP